MSNDPCQVIIKEGNEAEEIAFRGSYVECASFIEGYVEAAKNTSHLTVTEVKDADLYTVGAFINCNLITIDNVHIYLNEVKP